MPLGKEAPGDVAAGKRSFGEDDEWEAGVRRFCQTGQWGDRCQGTAALDHYMLTLKMLCVILRMLYLQKAI